MKIHTSLLDTKKKKISLKKAKNFIYSKSNGAESIFVGRVRNNNKGKREKISFWKQVIEVLRRPKTFLLRILGNNNKEKSKKK